ncbi:MAG: Gfo/Idh/MocA family oxidoreductase [Bacteroidales bacterium]|nr:Gfo/Idh/MocA family oxidoreductase [Bacteroidales bacterium]
MKNTRRSFIKRSAAAVAAIGAGGVLPGFSARSYASIGGAGEKIRIAVMGVNSRGKALAATFAGQENVEIIYICDVDLRAEAACSDNLEKLGKRRPASSPDFRRALDDRNLDALVIATPDHWHAPAAILAASAGKHVYLEKPCSHNPAEGELLVKAAEKYSVVMQMGNQRRSFPKVAEGIMELHSGIIGRPYYAKTWYTNNRPPIGRGKEVPVPHWLDYNLWQGPAPRRPYRDNVIHYNWHWFWHWGTGEALNNGTHFVDLARWGLGVDYPVKVSSSGGRFAYDDDWETPDTQVISMEFDNNTAIAWEGVSCNNRLIEGSSVGVVFTGEKGSLRIDGGNAYTVLDINGKVIREVKPDQVIDSRNTSNPAGGLDAYHISNFLEAIRKGTKLNADIAGGHKSTLLVQLGNIAQRSGKTLAIDPASGHILNDHDAERFWSREYEKGWEPRI